MELSSTERSTIRRYLLGSLPEDERARVRRKVFEDDDFYIEVVAQETDLLDAYVRHELSLDESLQVENHLLQGPESRRRLDFARGLARAGTAPDIGLPEPAERAVKRPRLRLLLASVLPLLLIVLLGAWLWNENLRLTEALQRLGDETARLRRQVDDLESSPKALGASDASDAKTIELPEALLMASILLSPRTRRDLTPDVRLSLPSRTGWVRLDLEIEHPDEFPFYEVVLTDVSGHVAGRRSAVAPLAIDGGHVLRIDVASDALPSGRLEVAVAGYSPQPQSSRFADPQPVAFYSATLTRD